MASAVAVAGVLVGVPAQAQVVPASGPGVLISEVASGGPGNAENFIEIANFGAEAADIGGWRIFRCGQQGDAYGPQAVVPEGTTLAPGQQYTAVRAGGNLEAQGIGDVSYDTSLHSFGFGAYLEDDAYNVVDRVGFYHQSVDSSCKNPVGLQNVASWALGQSHQRAGVTGDVMQDWIVAERTPGAPNAAEPQDVLRRGDIKISEFAPGGPGGYTDDFIELANYGADPVDVSGWKVWRCGDNAQTYGQSGGLQAGTTIQPGETYTLVRSGSASTVPAEHRDLTYGTSVHWIDSGAMVLTPDDEIVDRFSTYRDRMSPCTDGAAQPSTLDVLSGESYQRVSDTHDNSVDFVAGVRTPGAVSSTIDPVDRTPSPYAGTVELSEIVGAGPGGTNDEFFEFVNRGTEPVSLAGWSVFRCEGTGRIAPGPQIADLGDIVLAPGDVYVGAPSGASAEVLAQADGLYGTGLNQTDGYGIRIVDAAGRMVDGVGVYNSVPLRHCGEGYALRATTKDDQGESWQRARSTGVDGDDFVKAARTPGAHVDLEWLDETAPLPG